MKILKQQAIVLFISFLLFLVFIIIFKSIFFAQELIFPYSVTKFDIISRFPKVWFYIKFIYLITCFFNLLIFVNSVFKYLLIKGSKSKKENQIDTNIDVGNFHLFLGHNSINQKKVYIPEKGLYQNILITGTIGSRKNRFLYVSHFTSIN